jgi:hypothetical protein
LFSFLLFLSTTEALHTNFSYVPNDPPSSGGNLATVVGSCFAFDKVITSYVNPVGKFKFTVNGQVNSAGNELFHIILYILESGDPGPVSNGLATYPSTCIQYNYNSANVICSTIVGSITKFSCDTSYSLTGYSDAEIRVALTGTVVSTTYSTVLIEPIDNPIVRVSIESGDVSVSNFPTTFDVGNFPTIIDVGNFPTFPTTIDVGNFPAVTTVTVNNFPTSILVDNSIGNPLNVQIDGFTVTLPVNVLTVLEPVHIYNNDTTAVYTTQAVRNVTRFHSAPFTEHVTGLSLGNKHYRWEGSFIQADSCTTTCWSRNVFDLPYPGAYEGEVMIQCPISYGTVSFRTCVTDDSNPYSCSFSAGGTTLYDIHSGSPPDRMTFKVGFTASASYYFLLQPAGLVTIPPGESCHYQLITHDPTFDTSGTHVIVDSIAATVDVNMVSSVPLSTNIISSITLNTNTLTVPTTNVQILSSIPLQTNGTVVFPTTPIVAISTTHPIPVNVANTEPLLVVGEVSVTGAVSVTGTVAVSNDLTVAVSNTVNTRFVSQAQAVVISGDVNTNSSFPRGYYTTLQEDGPPASYMYPITDSQSLHQSHLSSLFNHINHNAESSYGDNPIQLGLSITILCFSLLIFMHHVYNSYKNHKIKSQPLFAD